MSLMVPGENVIKYWVPASRLLVGSIVSAAPESIRRLEVAASKLSTTLPVAEPERNVMVPAPRAIVSEKVRTMLLAKATPVAPSKGMKVETVGAVVSELWDKEEVETVPSENRKYSIS